MSTGLLCPRNLRLLSWHLSALWAQTYAGTVDQHSNACFGLPSTHLDILKDA